MKNFSAVVLAAGRGKRLIPYTDDGPKPLIPFKGKVLIEHVCDTLYSSGIEKILVVTGYQGDKIKSKLSDRDNVEIIPNSEWRKGNATSLLTAAPHIQTTYFVLSMADHLYPTSLLTDALESYNGRPTLIIDKSPDQLADISDATKVRVGEKNKIIEIGKNLEIWDAVDTGVFILPINIFKYLDRDSVELSQLMHSLIERDMLWGFDSSDANWVDLDTMRDFENAKEIVNWI